VKNIKWLAIVGLLAWACMSSLYAQSELSASEIQRAVIKKALGDFLKSEFDGSEDARQKYVVFGPSSAEAREFVRNPGGLSGQIVDVTADPIEIVKSYAMDGVNIDGNNVSVDVVFHVLAKAVLKNESRFIVPNDRDEKATYQMSFSGGRWMVFNPPMPRIGVGAVSDGLQLHIKGMDSIFKDSSKMSVAQQKTYEGYKDQLGQLNELMRKP
jgi:hypothetical protein